MQMPWTTYGLLAGVLVFHAASRGTTPTDVAATPCAQTGPACQASKADLKKAKSAFSRGLTLEKQNRIAEAFVEFDTAARLVPMNVDYVTAQALTRQHLVSEHVSRGNVDLEKGLQIEAQAEFRSAVTLDPGNQFAQQ